MRKLTSSIPLPIAGVALGFAALGNLLLPIQPMISKICEWVGVGIIVILIFTIILDMNGFLRKMENPIVATTFATFDMALIIIFTYFKQQLGFISTIGWGIGILIHAGLLFYVIKAFMLNFDLAKFFPTYFIPFVGYVVISITSPAYGMESLGKIAFWLGLFSFLALLVPLVRKYQNKIVVPKAAFPTYMIVAAPPSLCLAGYLSAFKMINSYMAIVLAIVSLLCTAFAYFIFLKMDHKEFYPSFAAGTFPFVISAIGMKKFTVYTHTSGMNVKWLSEIATVELIIAVAACLYILCYYVLALKKEQAKDKEKVSE